MEKNKKSKYKDFSSLARAIEERWGHTYEDYTPDEQDLPPGYDKAEPEETTDWE